MTLTTATARDNTVHLEQCVAVAGQPGCTCREIEANHIQAAIGTTTENQGMDSQSPDIAVVKHELLQHLRSELHASEAWVARNNNDGFPEAAASHQARVDQFKGYIAFVESASV